MGVCNTRQTTGVKYSLNWGTNLVLNVKDTLKSKLLGTSDELYEFKLGVSYLHVMIDAFEALLYCRMLTHRLFIFRAETFPPVPSAKLFKTPWMKAYLRMAEYHRLIHYLSKYLSTIRQIKFSLVYHVQSATIRRMVPACQLATA